MAPFRKLLTGPQLASAAKSHRLETTHSVVVSIRIRK